MKVPGFDRAIVDEAKVRDYLLASQHPIGRFKARVFVAAGYQPSEWQQLRADLVALVQSRDAALEHADHHGERWTVRGELTTPTGRLLPIVAVWLIPSTGEAPRLITAYPASS